MAQFTNQLNGLIKRLIESPKVMKGSVCSELIRKELESEKPSMIARFGSTEIKAILYPNLPFRKLMKKRIFLNMEILSGFYPVNEESIQVFSEMMKEDMMELDILGSWRVEEIFFKNKLKKVKKIALPQLEPYFQNDPWTAVLKNKRVLVIHPFANSIEKQYNEKRHLLFNDYSVLPPFKSIQTIKAVQSIAGNQNDFNDWFEALEAMKADIDKIDFEIAIIGCGAYGFPLAAHIKRIGKKSIHLGGATQILFGIKGRRWLEMKEFDNIINEHFVFPSSQETPDGNHKVEEGCYW